MVTMATQSVEVGRRGEKASSRILENIRGLNTTQGQIQPLARPLGIIIYFVTTKVTVTTTIYV